MDKFVAIATAPHVVAQIGLHPCLQPQTQANPALVMDPLFAVSGKPVFKLWEKVSNMHQSCDALLQFFSACKTTDESYSELASWIEGLWAKIDHLTPVAQTRAERGAEVTVPGILFVLPYKDHVCQSLLTQLNLTLEQAQEALVCIDTGRQLHIEGTDSANAAHSANCWTCKLPGCGKR